MAKGFKWFGKQVMDKINKDAEVALSKTSVLIQNKAKSSMTDPKSGKHYSGQLRQSSAPGEPPAVQIGQLRGSVVVEKSAPLTRRIGTGLKHGKHMELGTSKIKPRPYLRPAMDSESKKFDEFMKDKL